MKLDGLINLYAYYEGMRAGRPSSCAPKASRSYSTSSPCLPRAIRRALPRVRIGQRACAPTRSAASTPTTGLDLKYSDRKLKCPSCSATTASQCGVRNQKWTNQCPITIYCRPGRWSTLLAFCPKYTSRSDDPQIQLKADLQGLTGNRCVATSVQSAFVQRDQKPRPAASH
jgi:hypothetical protein